MTRSRFLLPLLLAVVAGASVFADAPSDADLAAAREATRAGAAHLEQGEFEEAIERLESALAAVPESREAKWNLALAHARAAKARLVAGRAEDALRAIDAALVHHEDRIAYRLLRAEALAAGGDPSRASGELENVLDLLPQTAHAWTLLSRIREESGEGTEALAAAEQAQALLPQSQEARARVERLTRWLEVEAGFGTQRTGHFTVRYGPDVDQRTVDLALTLLEDAYSRVVADLGLAPNTPAQVVLLPGDELERISGAPGWVGALYSHGTLRVPARNLEEHRESAARILAHEFTHHLLRQRIPRLPRWWHEGLAQYAEAPAATRQRLRVLRPALADLAATDRLLSYTQLARLDLGAMEARQIARLYYDQCYAFVAWLVEEHGTARLSDFLVLAASSGDVSESVRGTYGASEAELWGRFRSTLSE